MSVALQFATLRVSRIGAMAEVSSVSSPAHIPGIEARRFLIQLLRRRVREHDCRIIVREIMRSYYGRDSYYHKYT